jgi:hypothetical protein
MKKKIAGNWHKIGIWENKKCIVAYKAGGIVLHSIIKKRTERYIPFYNFDNFFIINDILYIRNKTNSVYKLSDINDDLLITQREFDQYTNEIDLNDLDLIEPPRALDSSKDIIVCAYKQKGIDFFSRKDKRKICHFDFPGYSFIDDIVIYKNKLYIADVFGLRVIDFSNFENLKLDDQFIHKGWPKDVATTNKFVFVADVLGIKIYSKIDNFKYIGKFETNKNRVAKVVVKDDIAFLACEARGLRILDLKNINNPKLVGGIFISKGAWGLYEFEDFLYIASYTEGLLKVDYKDVRCSKTVEKFSDKSEVIGVYVNKSAVFAACSHDGFKILNHNLELKTQVQINRGRCWTLVTKGTNLFAACGNAGVFIYDITDVYEPVMIGNIKTREARDLVVKNDDLYIADGGNGVEIYNIHDARSPFKIRNIPSGAFTRGIMVDENYVYKADGDGGLEVWSCN